MRISLIVAAAENNIIGHDGDLPWRLPVDLEHFKNTTMGHPVIMGRRTWDSFAGGLPGRTCIVMTRNPEMQIEGAEVVTSLEAALAAAGDAPDVFIAGGGEIYRMTMERAHRIVLTRVHVDVDGDAVFPELDDSVWHRTSAERHEADDRNPHACTFEIWERD